MDIISLSKAKKAKSAIKELQDRLGMNGTESGEKDVRDVYKNVKERLEELENKDPKIELYNRVSEIEASTHININKHNLRVNSILNKNKYNMTELVFDDFGDDSGIDGSLSSGYAFDSDGRLVKIADGEDQAEVVTTSEYLEDPPQMIAISIASNDQSTESSYIDKTSGTLTDVEFVDGKIQLKKIGTIPDSISEDDLEIPFYASTGTYESSTLDLGENFKSLYKLEALLDMPEGTEVHIYTSTSNDGLSFSEYLPLNQDNTIASPSGRFIKIKTELAGASEFIDKEVCDFTEDSRNAFHGNEYVEFKHGAKLKTSYQFDMSLDESWTDEGSLHKKKIKRSDWKKIYSIGVE